MLKNEFKQRKIGKTASSMRSQIPLHTPSGAQWTESDLEAKAVKQIAFVPNLYDLITQPILGYELLGKSRRYTPDIACIFQLPEEPLPGRFVIEVKRHAELVKRQTEFEDKFHAARELVPEMGAAFRILHEEHIDTAYLRNTLLLARDLGSEPDFHASDTLAQLFSDRPFSLAEAEEGLIRLYPEQWKRAEVVRNLIAWREVRCDLMQDIVADSQLWIPGDHTTRKYNDPFLKMLQTMDSGMNI